MITFAWQSISKGERYVYTVEVLTDAPDSALKVSRCKIVGLTWFGGKAHVVWAVRV